MKRIIVICLLATAVFMGGISLEAKTTKKKTVKTTQTTKKKSTSIPTAFPVEGKSYALRTSNEVGTSIMELIFKENGKGTLRLTLIMLGTANSDSADFIWKQNGDKVTLYTHSGGTPEVLTVVNEGKALQNSNGQTITLSE